MKRNLKNGYMRVIGTVEDIMRASEYWHLCNELGTDRYNDYGGEDNYKRLQEQGFFDMPK